MTSIRSRFSRSLVAAATGLGALASYPSDAAACGGFFCSRSPVDQTAEHIIFTVNDDATVTAYVQIRYAGDKDDFAWIIPAPGIPKLRADFPDLAMRGLDVATEPQYIAGGCNARRFNTAGAGGPSAAPPPAGNDGVTVLAKQSVGPFETVTLEGTSADVLVKWLNDNGYRINEKMTPLIQPYVEGGMHFVAMKLQADKTVSDIQPLVMTYDSDKPMIPLRLTSVAAQPEMGIVTFILSNRRWAPENYIDLKIPDSLIEFDTNGYQNNYLKLVSSETDKVGGQAFVTEYAKSTADLAQQLESQFVNPNIPDAQKSKDALLALVRQFPYLTRLYARMSAEEMTEDPIFMVSSATGDVNNVHDLTPPNFDFSKCSNTFPPPPPRCTFEYCGRQGACVDLATPNTTTSVPTAACVCANDATARVTTTGSTPAVYCEPVRLDLDSTDSGAGAPLLAPACEGFDCGPHGACVPMNGNPTCQCEGGYGATVTTTYDAMGKPTSTLGCQAIPGAPPAPPVLPPVGQTKIPTAGTGGHSSTGAGGATSAGATPGTGASAGAPSGPNETPPNDAAPSSSNDGGCGMARSPARDSGAALFLGLAAALAYRKRRTR